MLWPRDTQCSQLDDNSLLKKSVVHFFHAIGLCFWSRTSWTQRRWKSLALEKSAPRVAWTIRLTRHLVAGSEKPATKTKLLQNPNVLRRPLFLKRQGSVCLSWLASIVCRNEQQKDARPTRPAASLLRPFPTAAAMTSRCVRIRRCVLGQTQQEATSDLPHQEWETMILKTMNVIVELRSRPGPRWSPH